MIRNIRALVPTRGFLLIEYNLDAIKLNITIILVDTAMNISFMYDPYVRNSVKRHYLPHCLGNFVNKLIIYYFVFLDLFPLSYRKSDSLCLLELLSVSFNLTKFHPNRRDSLCHACLVLSRLQS